LPAWRPSRRLWAGAASGGDGLPNASSRRRRSPRVTDSPAPAHRRALDVRKEIAPSRKNLPKSGEVPQITHKKCHRPGFAKFFWTYEKELVVENVEKVKNLLDGFRAKHIEPIIVAQLRATFYSAYDVVKVGLPRKNGHRICVIH
jgi:uncharacterized protein YeaO (DUF488 family)